MRNFGFLTALAAVVVVTSASDAKSALTLGPTNSSVALAAAAAHRIGVITFYAGNGGGGEVVCTLQWSDNQLWNFGKYEPCGNDRARSATILLAEPGTLISFYANGYASKEDSYMTVKVLKTIDQPVTIDTFEKSIKNEHIDATFHHNSGGIDGELSGVEIFFW